MSRQRLWGSSSLQRALGQLAVSLASIANTHLAFRNTLNAVQLGPGTTVSLAANTFQRQNPNNPSNSLVFISGSISGTSGTASAAITVSILKGVTILAEAEINAGAANGNQWAAALSTVDPNASISVPPSYSLQAVSAANLTVPIDFAQLTLIELPPLYVNG